MNFTSLKKSGKTANFFNKKYYREKKSRYVPLFGMGGTEPVLLTGMITEGTDIERSRVAPNSKRTCRT